MYLGVGGAAVVAHGGELGLRVEELVLRLCELVALGEDRVGGVLDVLLELGEEVGLLLGRCLEDANALDDRLVLFGDALEELGLLEQVFEAVGPEDHRERVRLVGLVQLDQAVREGVLCRRELLLQPGQPLARLVELAAHLEQLRALLVERRLDPVLLALEDVDVPLKRIDPDVVGRDRLREDVLLVLLALDKRARLVDPLGERCG